MSNEKAPLIYKKMSEVQKAIGAVGKDQVNTVQKFKFRGIDQFINSLYPALTEHGVFMVPKVVSEAHKIREVTRRDGSKGTDKLVYLQMSYTFYAEDGSNVTVGPIPSEGLDSGDKATNKALSAALKYALIQTFSIPTEDMSEGDLDSPELGVKGKSKEASTTSAKATAANGEATTAKKTSSFRPPPKKTKDTSEETDGWN